MSTAKALYDDGVIRCDDQGLTIRRYYLWGAEKRIPYASVKGFMPLPMTGGLGSLRKWRLWGSGDFVHWWNLDPRRPKKELALVLDIGRRVYPTITPDDPTEVARILTERTDGR
jgi:hypothetical protein